MSILKVSRITLQLVIFKILARNQGTYHHYYILKSNCYSQNKTINSNVKVSNSIMSNMKVAINSCSSLSINPLNSTIMDKARIQAERDIKAELKSLGKCFIGISTKQWNIYRYYQSI